jgi:hypothetical protein
MNTLAETRRLARWACELTDRRAAGEAVVAEELLAYQRAKVALLAAIARKDRTVRAEETLAAARARLAELEAA